MTSMYTIFSTVSFGRSRRLFQSSLCGGCDLDRKADDRSSFVSYRTGHYKLHYYETPTSLKFVMVTDTKTNNLRIVLHQIYVGLYVEYGEMTLDYQSVTEYYSGQKPSITSGTSSRLGRRLRDV